MHGNRIFSAINTEKKREHGQNVSFLTRKITIETEKKIHDHIKSELLRVATDAIGFRAKS